MTAPRLESRPVEDLARVHARFVDDLTARGLIRTARVESAFRAVRRDRFVPESDGRGVYVDETIVTKESAGVTLSSSSRPTLMAAVLEQLDVQPGHRVLEIGAGTGYNAALMAHLAGPTGHVVTIDIDRDIVDGARRHLDAVGCDTVTTICGDGAIGFPDAGPYDRIVATVAAGDITPAWREQLSADGLIVVPVVVRGPQKSIAFACDADGLCSRRIVECHYIPLRGDGAESLREVPCGLDGRVTVTVDQDVMTSTATLDAALATAAATWHTGVTASLSELQSELSFWLALQNPGFCTVRISEGPACSRILDHVFGAGTRFRPLRTMGAVGERGLCVLAAAPVREGDAFELTVQAFGDAEALAERLIAQMHAWHARGRPSSRTLHVTARRRGEDLALTPRQLSIAKKWHTYVFDWQH